MPPADLQGIFYHNMDNETVAELSRHLPSHVFAFD